MHCATLLHQKRNGVHCFSIKKNLMASQTNAFSIAACSFCHNSSTVPSKNEDNICRKQKQHSVANHPPWDESSNTPQKRRLDTPESSNTETSKRKLRWSDQTDIKNLALGSKVVALWAEHDNVYYPGTVTCVHSITPPQYDVSYADGQKRKRVPLASIVDITVYAGMVNLLSPSNKQVVTGSGAICALRARVKENATTRTTRNQYDPQEYEYAINQQQSTNAGKKESFFLQIDCISTKQMGVPLIEQSTVKSQVFNTKQGTSSACKSTKTEQRQQATTSTSKKYSDHQPQKTSAKQHSCNSPEMSGVYTTLDNENPRLIVKKLKQQHSTCDQNCQSCKGTGLKGLTPKDIVTWNKSVHSSIEVSCKFRAGTQIIYRDLSTKSHSVQISKEQTSQDRSEASFLGAPYTNLKSETEHDNLQESKQTNEMRSNAHDTTTHTPLHSNKHFESHQKLDCLWKAHTLGKISRGEDNILLARSDTSADHDTSDQQEATQLKIKKMQQSDADATRIKNKNMEISAQLRALHPQRKTVNSQRVYAFKGVRLGLVETRREWMNHFLTSVKTLEEIEMDEISEIHVLKYYNSLEHKNTLKMAIQEADQKILPTIVKAQEQSATDGNSNLIIAGHRHKRQKQRNKKSLASTLQHFHSSLGLHNEMAVTIIANPRVRNDIKIITSHDGGSQQLYAMSQLLHEDQLWHAVVGNPGSVFTPTLHTERSKLLLRNITLMKDIREFSKNLLDAIHEEVQYQLNSSPTMPSRASILKTVWPNDIDRLRATKTIFRSKNRSMLFLLSVFRLLQCNNTIKLHIKPRLSDTLPLKGWAHDSGSDVVNFLVLQSVVNVEQHLKAAPLSAGQAQDPVTIVCFHEDFCKQMENILSTQENFNSAAAWPVIKMHSRDPNFVDPLLPDSSIISVASSHKTGHAKLSLFKFLKYQPHNMSEEEAIDEVCMWIDISYCAQALFLTNLNFMIFCKT